MAGQGFDPLYLKTLPSIGVLMGTRSAYDDDDDDDPDGADDGDDAQGPMSVGSQWPAPSSRTTPGGTAPFGPDDASGVNWGSGNWTSDDGSSRDGDASDGGGDDSAGDVFTDAHGKKVPKTPRGVHLASGAQGAPQVFQSGSNTVEIYPDQSTVIWNAAGNVIGGYQVGTPTRVAFADNGHQGNMAVHKDAAGYTTKAYGDYGTVVLGPDNKPVAEVKPPPNYVPFLGAHPQTITDLPGAVLSSNSRMEIDNDGPLTDQESQIDLEDHDDRLPPPYNNLDPFDTPYLVFNSEKHPDYPISRNSKDYAPVDPNHGIQPGDFGVIVYKGHTYPAPYVDPGHALGGEASIAALKETGRPLGATYNDGIEPEDAYTLSFPGSGTGFQGDISSASDQAAYVKKLYNNYVKTHPEEVKRYNFPAQFDNSPAYGVQPGPRRRRR